MIVRVARTTTENITEKNSSPKTIPATTFFQSHFQVLHDRLGELNQQLGKTGLQLAEMRHALQLKQADIHAAERSGQRGMAKSNN